MMSLLPLLLLLPSVLTTPTLVSPHGQAILTLPLPTRQYNTSSVLTVTTSSTTTSPGTLVFSVFYRDHLNSWILEPSVRPRITQELCADPGKEEEDDLEFVQVRVFSTSSSTHSVDLSASWSKAELREGEDMELTLIPGSAQTLYHLASPDYNQHPSDTYLLSLTSVTRPEDCLYLTISRPSCPWPDSPATAKHGIQWARVLAKGFFQIRAANFPESFTVSLVPLADSSECHSRGWRSQGKEEAKVVTLRVERVRTKYWKPVVVSLVGIVLSSLVIMLLWGLAWRLNLKNNQKRILHRKRSLMGLMKDFQGYQIAEGVVAQQTEQLQPLQECCAEVSIAADTPLRQENILRHKLASELEDKGGVKNRLQVHRILQEKLYLNDLSKAMRDNWHRRQRSKVYLYLVPLLAVFYLIPSVQMVFTVQDMAEETGSLEQCYLNFGCSRPWGELEDFNHIISNSGYIIYGLVFIIMVRLKSWFLPKENRTDTDHQGVIGLPQQHSIFYTMGVCMVLQGAFSSIFHVCPSNISLQFDTTMMYVMLMLVFVKVYQFRHPDISTNAYPAMYTFAVALGMEACSLYIFTTSGKVMFYTLFCLCYLGLLLYLTIDCYYYGAGKGSLRGGIPVLFKNSWENGTSCLYPTRFVLAVLFVTLNLGLMCYFLIRCLEEGARSLSTPILVICSVNVGIWLTYYTVLKLNETIQSKEGEADCGLRWGLRFSSYIFFLLALILGIIAMSFYARRHQSRNSTPAESRDRNELCNVMDFFDNHDMWHFLSAVALFLTFIFLLTIDDDILLVDRDKIRVF